MQTETIAISIPILFILVTGLVTVTSIYLKSRERQMLIEKGLSAEDVRKFFERKRGQNSLLKIGIIAIFFGIGLGTGMMLEDYFHREYWVPFSLFTITGIGFVVSNIVGNKMEKNG